MALKIDGNTGHSSGWWWKHASPFYFGATLSYNKDDKLKYNPGRSDKFFRNTCKVNPCVTLKNDCGRCDPNNDAWMRVTNSKSFLTAGVGFVSASRTRCQKSHVKKWKSCLVQVDNISSRSNPCFAFVFVSIL